MADAEVYYSLILSAASYKFDVYFWNRNAPGFYRPHVIPQLVATLKNQFFAAKQNKTGFNIMIIAIINITTASSSS